MDCKMPEMDGFEATRRLREVAGIGESLIIIAITASTLTSDRDLCREAGMDDYLSKPTTLEMLGECLATWLSSGRLAA